MRAARLWFGLPPAMVCLADVVLTLSGQPSAYWGGDYGAAVDVNPLALHALAWHPAAFGVGAAAWLVTVVAVLALVPAPWARALGLVVTFFHGVGAATWLVRWGVVGWVAAVALLVLAERLLAFSWARGGTALRRRSDAP